LFKSLEGEFSPLLSSLLKFLLLNVFEFFDHTTKDCVTHGVKNSSG